MKNFNMTKLDSKGRLLIPFHIREILNLDSNTEFVIMNNGKRELKILPLIHGVTAELNVVMDDAPGSLAKAADTLGKRHVDIIISQSRTVEKGKRAEWHVIVDISSCKNFRKVVDELREMKSIKDIEMIE